ncbi:putative GNAT family acetyltransferase [Catenulispora sp. MAP12-49]|uniref:GNAT family N-acetyltransferase n=1 Tax=Catenulispora sp. MAP12-49 TaxID=3156302 RepID=UPI003512646A
MSDEVTVLDNKERKRYEARIGGALAGILAYTVQDGVAVMPHTVVEPQFEGRGIGGKLAKAALDDVRERGLKVAPRCWFVAAYIEKHPEYTDLVVD